MADAAEAVSVAGISKSFGATTALDDASFSARPGEVLALLGENGAGKSTMVKLLSGLIQPDSGVIKVDGQTVRLRRPADAHRHGIQTAFQEMTLVPDLSVGENMLISAMPTGPLGLIRHRAGREKVEAHLAAMGLGFVDPRREARDYDLAIRQKIEIARAVMRTPRLLLLDEPTSTLSGRDIDWLGDLIADQKARGVTVIFISHRLPEVRRFCDRLTVLRNGTDVGTSVVDEVDDDTVVKMIIGRSLSATFPPKPEPKPRSGGEVPVLAARSVATEGRLEDASFELWPGEILGVAGLQGMGQRELFLACFGMAAPTSGHIEVDGERVMLASPADAMHRNVGIAMVPEDRRTEGLFLKLSGRFNASLPSIERYRRGLLIDTGRETRDVAMLLERVQVHQRALYTPASALSGGNQQKLAIGKWLLTGSRILLLFDPTRGVDVGTKHQLYQLMREFADAGGAVLLYSTEIPEIVNLCERVVIMYGGRTVAHLDGGDISEDQIIRSAIGEEVLRPAEQVPA
jgi:ribose transport system ATP-binding protein